jgi:hypothetical protein
MADPKPPPHPPRQAKFPGRSMAAPHRKKLNFQTDAHAKAMKRAPEVLHLAKHYLHGKNKAK